MVGYLGQEKNRLEKSLSKSIEINKYAKTSVFKGVNGMEKNIYSNTGVHRKQALIRLLLSE